MRVRVPLAVGADKRGKEAKVDDEGQVDWVGGRGDFDVVVASEVIYEEHHAAWVCGCLEAYLRPGGAAYLIGSTVPERPGWETLKRQCVLCSAPTRRPALSEPCNHALADSLTR
jgi:hypothetical protein